MYSILALCALLVAGPGCRNKDDDGGGGDETDLTTGDVTNTDGGQGTDDGGAATDGGDDTGSTGGSDIGTTGAGDDTASTTDDTDGATGDTDDTDDTGDTGFTEPEDLDGDGYDSTTDCDDADPDVHPGAGETPYDGVDNDCDEETADDDLDGDGFVVFEDCDDDPLTGALVNPDADELCDTIDNNCDGQIDEDSAVDVTTWYRDVDGDTYGDEADTLASCEAPEGYVEYAGDCDDADIAYNPAAIEDDCTDPNDYNCDGAVGYADGDGDGFAACEECDDLDAAVNPDATETCDAIDNNCDGEIDEAAAVDAVTWYQDADVDGYGAADVTTLACDQPEGFIDNGDDCDDGDAGMNRDDIDGDGFTSCDGDCDDASAASMPGAAEVCDAADNDCDGVVDNEAIDALTFFADLDMDGYGDAENTLDACELPEGYTTDDADCDDGAAGVSPDAVEYCDGIDNNCDGAADEDAADVSAWYLDADGDGYGLESELYTVEACDQPDGYAASAGDCDDASAAYNPGAVEDDCSDPNDYNCDGSVAYTDGDGDGFAACEECDDDDVDVYPGAAEVCDAIDNNCDGVVDEDEALDASAWYADSDGDGFGDADVTTEACERPEGYLADSSDCDDSAGGTFPGAVESCDDVDQDCDGGVDEEASDALTFYADADEDGYGDEALTLSACEAPAGFIADSSDCDDSDAGVNPGATEICDDIDNDCDGVDDEDDASDARVWFFDYDGDGYGDPDFSDVACEAPAGFIADSSDCDDARAAISPGATEICDGVDNNCDDDTDGPDAVDKLTWYADKDEDDYGDAADSWEACDQPVGYIADSTDCDDVSGANYPGADEVCDGEDNNCDGVTDEDEAVDASSWYGDMDSDGYGDPNMAMTACDQPVGYIDNADDCDDDASGGADINPAAAEVCDDVDNNCDGDIDEDAAADVVTWYLDADDDGYGRDSFTDIDCDQPTGFVATGGDCDDGDASASPAGVEVCDAADNDCDDGVDEGVEGAWYFDFDEDGYGNDSYVVSTCDAPSSDFVSAGGDCDDDDAGINPGVVDVCDDTDRNCDGVVADDADGDGWSDVACGGSDCDDTDDGVLPEQGAGCAVGATCLDILDEGLSNGDGDYIIDPDGYGTGVDPVEVYCDMTTDGGGWTQIAFVDDLIYGQQFSGSDAYRWLTSDFETVLTEDEILAIQAQSTEGKQTYVSLCNGVVTYYYTGGSTYGYAFGFRFLDGTETPSASASYAPYDVTVTQDVCANNGGEGGSEANATVFEFNSVLVPVVNVFSRDNGGSGEYFGAPLVDNPAWLR